MEEGVVLTTQVLGILNAWKDFVSFNQVYRRDEEEDPCAIETITTWLTSGGVGSARLSLLSPEYTDAQRQLLQS